MMHKYLEREITSDLSDGQSAAPGRLAYEWQTGQGPPIMFLSGFASTMQGIKAQALADHCTAADQAFLRFDYLGHGASDGQFTDGTIGQWLADALAIFDHCIQEPAILVGSSMGGWLMLHVARQRPELVAGLIGLASAPDFIDRLYGQFSDEQRRQIRRQGQTTRPSAYGEPLVITKRLVEDAPKHNLLATKFELTCPCHLIHGQNDSDVPWTISLELAAAITSPHVTIDLIKDGDHRLSRPSDLRRITMAINRISERLQGAKNASS